jgi:hypothetical protein
VSADVAAVNAGYAALPSHRTALDRDGFADRGAIVIAGDEDAMA